jgi:hypothetical protein
MLDRDLAEIYGVETTNRLCHNLYNHLKTYSTSRMNTPSACGGEIH